MSNLETVEFRRTFLLHNFVYVLIVFLLVTYESECQSGKDVLSNLRPLKYSAKKEACKTFCNSITCETIKQCKIGTIQKKASYCNCCDACVKYLGKCKYFSDFKQF